MITLIVFLLAFSLVSAIIDADLPPEKPKPSAPVAPDGVVVVLVVEADTVKAYARQPETYACKIGDTMTATILLVCWIAILWLRVELLEGASRTLPREWSADTLDRSLADLARARAMLAEFRRTGQLPPKKPGERY
jgi:hypothetical protein